MFSFASSLTRTCVLLLLGGHKGSPFFPSSFSSSSSSSTFADALFAEDAGLLDFSVATTGHGVTRFAHATTTTTTTGKDGGLVLTTDAPPPAGGAGGFAATTSCYVAGRRTVDGSLAWRRNVCSTVPRSSTDDGDDGLGDNNNSNAQSHGVAVHGDRLYTVDGAGVVRAWTVEDGALLWDAQVDAGGKTAPRVWAATGPAGTAVVAVASNEELVLLRADTGRPFDTLTALSALGHGGLKGGKRAQWLSVFSPVAGTVHGVFALVDADGVVKGGGDMYLVELELGNDQFKSVQALHHTKGGGIVADSFQVQDMGDGKWHGLALAKGGGALVDVSLGDASFSDQLQPSQLHPRWVQVVAVRPTSAPSVVQVLGREGPDAEASMALFRFHEGTGRGWERLHGAGESPAMEYTAVTHCPGAEMVVAMDGGALRVYRHEGGNSRPLAAPVALSGDVFVPDGDSAAVFSVLECSADGMRALLGTERGSTVVLSFGWSDPATVAVKVHWSHEEGLAAVTSAIVLDASHVGFDDLVEEKDVVEEKLSLSGRLSSQWDGLVRMLSTGAGMIGSANFSGRDHFFGFVKVAALLSPTSHRMWGIETAGKVRGTIRWSLDLPKEAVWHRMVHGTTNSAKAVHGINGDTHSREILVLSVAPSSVGWMCVDGTSGAVNDQGSIPVSSPIVQVVPLYGASTGGCRQASLLLHEDLTLSTVPDDAETVDLARKHIGKTPNGLYTHRVDKVTNQMESYQVVSASSGFVARPVGRTSFAGERIVQVTYPIRHERVQSMSTILGDNSLLLKYINPHMAVVLTMLADKGEQTPTMLAKVLDQRGERNPRKPAGAGETAASESGNEGGRLPNMFINLVDTVSGRVLHRTSHTNVDERKRVSIVVTENWVIYSYVNANTRRTEIGVLTLHEGMIDSKGMTMFSSPEQTTSFSSFDARESKPVVLAKTYAFSKTVTALGVTSTRQGISSQNILLATADGALNTLHRILLETRRPMGEAKPNEKKEGLVPYRELIPESPLLSLTYNQTLDPFTRIVTAETSLESQSLVLGFGGPDLFFTRTSPTKGFDLLPETFNKAMVGIATVAIVAVLLVVKRMGSSKAFTQGWL